MSRATLIVIAKAPADGQAKTRLCPPLAPTEAAEVAAAALRDTLDAAASVADVHPLLVLDGSPGPWLPARFPGEVVPQGDGGLGDRLAAAFADARHPALAVGMDTPQLTPGVLGHALEQLTAPGVDAVLGPAFDGGYWAIGLRRPVAGAFHGVPMSTPWTGAAQRARLRALGLRIAELEELRDVDTIADARAVAAEFPGTRFAATLASFGLDGPAVATGAG